jgi:hypothetical protein
MMEAAMADDWEAKARASASARRAVWVWSPVFIAVGGLAVIGGIMAPVAWIRWSGFVCGGALTLWGFVYGTYVYMRTIDEQERDANLWGAYVGICAYLLLFPLSELLAMLGTQVPHAPYVVFMITMTTVLAVFAWKRFR